MCRAATTTPMPPWPRIPSTWYLPPRMEPTTGSPIFARLPWYATEGLASARAAQPLLLFSEHPDGAQAGFGDSLVGRRSIGGAAQRTEVDRGAKNAGDRRAPALA